tara:strand:+ start:4819 stop:6285 length:1467 start_codon:yes stop_codon:yes gene_type:complete
MSRKKNPTNLVNLIAEKLKTARKENKMTQEQVANTIGIHVVTYGNYELASYSPSLKILEKLAFLFNKPEAWFFAKDPIIQNHEHSHVNYINSNSNLIGKKILLGVTGSISIYKSLYLASQLKQCGALVKVIMSESSQKFITSLSFEYITQEKVITSLFEISESNDHIYNGNWADIIVVAPATAHTIARIANGIADDPLVTTILASNKPKLIFPAMESNMWKNDATQSNIQTLKSRGFKIIGPVEGYLASGSISMGRMVEPLDIISYISTILGEEGNLQGKTFVITAGPTREPIDPIRYISNNSSGKMGFALAHVARDRGAKTILVTGPTQMTPPIGIDSIQTNTANEMYETLKEVCINADVLIMAAAVSDWTPTTMKKEKIKKSEKTEYTLKTKRTLDILSNINYDNLFKVGFAAETKNLEENAKQKLINKNLDVIVANNVTEKGAGFSIDTNKVTIIDNKGNTLKLGIMPKYEVANQIINKIISMMS